MTIEPIIAPGRMGRQRNVACVWMRHLERGLEKAWKRPGKCKNWDRGHVEISGANPHYSRIEDRIESRSRVI